MTLPSGADLAARMAELARATAGARSASDVLVDVTAAAVELIPGVDTAGILLVGRDGHESVASTTESEA